MHREVWLGVLVSFVMFMGTACSKEAEKRYELTGKVVAVDLKGQTVTLNHEEVKGFMDAMTMPFRLQDKDRFYLDKMNTGDKVQATLVVAGTRSWLENLVISQETPAEVPTTAKVTEPQAGEAIPDFTLVNQDGKKISFTQYKGKAVLLTFIYTRCPLPDYCPMMTNNFAEINRTLASRPALQKQAHLLSITVDPEYDTPAVLREYGLKYNGNQKFANWEFATGSTEEVKKIATYFGLHSYSQDNQIIHNLQTALIAPEGKFVKMYRHNEWKPQEVIGDLQKILQVTSGE